MQIGNHGPESFDERRNTLSADRVQLLCIDIKIVMGKHVSDADGTAPLDLRVPGEQLTLRLPINALELLSRRYQDHANCIHPVVPIVVGHEICRFVNRFKNAGECAPTQSMRTLIAQPANRSHT